jgi:site-specific DNA-methyltransferase (adenine-specific)
LEYKTFFFSFLREGNLKKNKDLEVNKIYHDDWMNNQLPDKSVQLIIADPPYFEVKGSFDFIWNSFDEYLIDVEKWAVECKRLLADNGTLFWYGHAKKIAYAQVIFDMHFNLINNLVWDKGSFMGLEEIEGLRSFAPCTERILMYENKNDCKDGFEPSYIRDYFQDYLMNERKKAALSTKDINIICGYSENTRNKIINNEKNWIFITEKSYNLLQKETGYFQKPYQELRKEYEELRRPFANYFKLQEIFRFSNEAVKTGSKYDHETVKPETLTRALILTCSRKNDLVLVPFAGSGTEVAMAIKEGRNTIGFDIEEKYVEMGNKRTDIIKSQPSLFF